MAWSIGRCAMFANCFGEHWTVGLDGVGSMTNLEHSIEVWSMSKPVSPLPEDNYMSIRIGPVIRYFGASVALVAGFPSAIGVFYFLFNPGKAFSHPVDFLFCLLLFSIASFAMYRWLTARGEASEREVYLRGFIRSYRIPTDQLEVVEVYYTDEDIEGRKSLKEFSKFLERLGWSTAIPKDLPNSGIYLQTWDGKPLGKVPALLRLSPEYQQFIDHLRWLASAPRNI